jgi:hypothetical protein
MNPILLLRQAASALAAATCCFAVQAEAVADARVDVLGQMPLHAACPSVDEAALADELTAAWFAADKPSTVTVTFKVQGQHVFDVLPHTNSTRAFHAIRHAVHQLACEGGDDQPHAVGFVIRFVAGGRGETIVVRLDDAATRL